MPQHVGCTDWTTSGTDRHRCTQKGYAAPEIADDFALHCILVIEEIRQRRGLRPDQVVVCGVDNSTTAFAMALLRLCPDRARYRFCSGRKGEEECGYCGCNDCDACCGTLDDYTMRDCYLWVLLDDDICQGRAARTVARHHPVDVFTINNYLADSVDWDCYPCVEWMENCTFHWWGADSFASFGTGQEPDYQCMEGCDVVARYMPKENDDE